MGHPWEPPECGHTTGGSSGSIKTFGHPNGATEEQEGGQDRDKRRALKPWLWFWHLLLHRGSPASPFSEPTVLVKILTQRALGPPSHSVYPHLDSTALGKPEGAASSLWCCSPPC